MRPVGDEILAVSAPLLEKVDLGEPLSGDNLDGMLAVLEAGAGPLKSFLKRNSGETELALFGELAEARTIATTAVAAPSGSGEEAIDADSLLVVFPAFVITELTEAFQIGFVVLLPFLVIDIVISNILLALGMHMLSPTTISLPFKLLLFVMVDGWYLLSKALVLGYN